MSESRFGIRNIETGGFSFGSSGVRKGGIDGGDRLQNRSDVLSKKSWDFDIFLITCLESKYRYFQNGFRESRMFWSDLSEISTDISKTAFASPDCCDPIWERFPLIFPKRLSRVPIVLIRFGWDFHRYFQNGFRESRLFWSDLGETNLQTIWWVILEGNRKPCSSYFDIFSDVNEQPESVAFWRQ